jgi:hypothetical protein
MSQEQNDPAEDVDWSKSQPGEPEFMFGQLEVAPGVNLSVMIVRLAGMQVEIVMRPDLALSVAAKLHESAKLAKSNLVIPGMNGKPIGMQGAQGN